MGIANLTSPVSGSNPTNVPNTVDTVDSIVIFKMGFFRGWGGVGHGYPGEVCLQDKSDTKLHT